MASTRLMPGESFIENNVDFERKWLRFSKIMWVVLSLLLLASATGLSGGGGPLAKRSSRAQGLEVEWERIARAGATSRWRFVVEAPSGEARLVLRDGMAAESTLRDITPPPKSVLVARDGMTLVYQVEPGSAATVRLTQAIHKPGLLRSTVEAGGASLALEQIVLP